MSGSRSPLLVADIGGTNARLGVAQWDTASAAIAVAAIRTLPCSGYRDIAELLGDYLQALPQDAARPRQASLAIAGPLQDNVGTLTNIGWRVDGAELAQRLGLDHAALLNDFAALASGVPYLNGTEVLRIRGAGPTPGPISVVGAGTGFGAALLVPNDTNGWDLVPTEAGHVSFAPTSRREQQVWEFLRGYDQHVCVEHVLSGTGIVNIHRALGGADIGPDEISRRALAGGDARCRETIDIFCEVFGSVAGNVALAQGARGGVFLGGGILPKLLPLFEPAKFLARFDAKGIMADYVRALPVALITAEYPALTGAAMWYWGTEKS